MKIYIFTTLFIFLFVTTAQAAGMSATCLNEKGKATNCIVSHQGGVLIIEYAKKHLKHLDKRIPGKKITKLTGGEYSRRRVAESIITGIVLTPLALFGLFAKKKRDSFGIEYLDDNNNPEATLVMIKKKYGLALKSTLQSISGKTVEYEDRAIKNKNKN